MRTWGPAYTEAELNEAQRKFGLRFPPDLIALLKRGRLPGGWDWTADEAGIRRVLAAPLKGLLFDVEHNALWLAGWGQRPHSASARADIVRQAVSEAPRLIPLVGLRFIPEEPSETGNPVFSVMQADIIYYGSDLANYVANEFSAPSQYVLRDPIRRIRFWSDLVDRNNGGPR